MIKDHKIKRLQKFFVILDTIFFNLIILKFGFKIFDNLNLLDSFDSQFLLFRCILFTIFIEFIYIFVKYFLQNCIFFIKIFILLSLSLFVFLIVINIITSNKNNKIIYG